MTSFIIPKNWSQRSGLNRRPIPYEGIALPLSYAGLKPRCCYILERVTGLEPVIFSLGRRRFTTKPHPH